MKHSIIPLVAAFILSLTACRPNQATPTAEADTVAVQFDQQEAPVAPVVIEEVQPKARPAKAAPAAKATPRPAKAKGETIYVETEGAQGRVWGHITMQGDRGTGTIHDWDENTWAVNVTRHGNELFAVDQNSRQYVFRLK